MRRFADWKTSRKLALGFGVCIVLALAVGLTAINKMSQMNSNTGVLVTDTLAGTKILTQVVDDVYTVRLHGVRCVLTPDANTRAELEAKAKDKSAEVDADLVAYEKSVSDAEERKLYQGLRDAWGAYQADHARMMSLARQHDLKSAASQSNGQALSDFAKVAQGVEALVDYNSKHGDHLAAQAATGYSMGRTTVIGLLALACVMALGLAVVVTRAIVPPLNRMTSAADHLAMGELNQDVTVNSEDEIGKLAGSFHRMIAYQQQMANAAEAIAAGDLTQTVRPMSEGDALGTSFARMVSQLSNLIAQARAASNGIAAAAREVSIGNEDLSQRTSEQASSLEETASSMEEMSVTVKQNAENTRQANQLATQARDVAERGGEVVQSAVSSMEGISQASRRISEIVAVIDEIAFQTNLLALNAAVEAARVGEQGRGFAVVAAEVRSLAGRSSTAAKEIKALVQDSGQKVQEGSELVHESGERLNDIVTAVKKVADIVAEISAASQEQAEGIEQVNKAVMQMDQITQQNAALVEEASAASQSASAQAQALQEVVATFRLDPSYVEAVERSVATKRLAGAGAERAALPATGTDGKPAHRGGRPKAAPKLRVVQDDGDFEQF